MASFNVSILFETPPYFLVDDVARAQKAYRLQRDFDASFTAVAMMLDLIEELERLRRL